MKATAARMPTPGAPDSDPERLVRTYADLILRVSYTYLKSTQDAEDICQDVLMKRLRRTEPFQSFEHERAWVIRVTANATKDLLRRSSRKLEVVGIDDIPEPAAPEEDVGAADPGSGVLDAVMRLPLIYREAIYLHYYEGYSIKEIARLTERSESAVAQHLSRGRAKLRTILEGDSHEHLV